MAPFIQVDLAQYLARPFLRRALLQMETHARVIIWICHSSVSLHLLLASAGVPGRIVDESVLEVCLRRSISSVVMTRDAAYNASRQCKSTRLDISPVLIAVVRVQNVTEVQTAVQCGARHGTHVCARAGGHGFENDAGCSGGVVIDLQDLRSLDVNESSHVIRFGAGNTLGQLYYKLQQEHDLVVPGGAESGVGAAGLGCGRGMLTQL